MSEAEIIGLASQQQKTHAQEFLKKEKAVGKYAIEGESRKTLNDRQFIKTANHFIQEELKDLEITDFPSFSANNFHIFNNTDHTRQFGQDAPDAVTDTMSSAVFLNKDRYENRFAFFVALFHEGVHLVSHQKFQYYQGNLPVATYRAGYTNTDFRKNPYSEHFRGFDEGVVDLITRESIEKNWDEISKQLHFTSDNKTQLEALKTSATTGYGDYSEVIRFLLSKVAENNNEPYETVWRRIKEGVFTGDMMHLRDIERAFGKGSLRILAYLGASKDGEPQKQDPEIVLRWFKSTNYDERDQIAREFLPVQEYEVYLKRQ